MTEQQQHTPSTGQVETGFALYLHDYENIVIGAGRERFKAWLATNVAAAEQRGAEKAWDEGYKASDHEAYYFSTHGNTENPYRADQIQGDTDDQT